MNMQYLLPYLLIFLAIPAAIVVALNTRGELNWLKHSSLKFLFSNWARIGFLVFGALTAHLACPTTFSTAFVVMFLWSLLAVANSKKQSFANHLKQQFLIAWPYIIGVSLYHLTSRIPR
jgi:hypothetical protein